MLLGLSKEANSVLVRGRREDINIVLEGFQAISYQKLIIFLVEFNICLQYLDTILMLINKGTNHQNRQVKHMRGVKISEGN